MKHIIEHYRWLLDQNDRLAVYARKLELNVDRLKDEIAKKGMINRKRGEAYVQLNRERKRLKAHIDWLNKRLDALDGNTNEDSL